MHPGKQTSRNLPTFFFFTSRNSVSLNLFFGVGRRSWIISQFALRSQGRGLLIQTLFQVLIEALAINEPNPEFALHAAGLLVPLDSYCRLADLTLPAAFQSILTEGMEKRGGVLKMLRLPRTRERSAAEKGTPTTRMRTRRGGCALPPVVLHRQRRVNVGSPPQESNLCQAGLNARLGVTRQIFSGGIQSDLPRSPTNVQSPMIRANNH